MTVFSQSLTGIVEYIKHAFMVIYFESVQRGMHIMLALYTIISLAT